MATVRPNPPAHLLVLGIVMSEKTYTSRIRWLRAYYSDPLVNSGSAVLVRFVIEANWWARRIVEVPSSASDDVLGVVTMSDLPQRHCAHKMVGWWRAAARWPAVFYGKTDDDAAIDLPRLVPLLMQSLPRTRVFAGVVRYSSINESDWQGVCWAPGAGGALKLRRRDPACAASHVYGPFPFVEGPLVLMSADVQSWLAPKLAIDRRQLCHFEDLLLGRELSHHPALELINLDRLIGRSNVIAGRAQGGGWVGATGLLAHWVRTEKNFRRAVVEFQRTAQQQQLWKGGDAQRTVAPASNLTLECSLWRSSYADLAFYPCCQNWTLCVGRAVGGAREEEQRTAALGRHLETRGPPVGAGASSLQVAERRAPALGHVIKIVPPRQPKRQSRRDDKLGLAIAFGTSLASGLVIEELMLAGSEVTMRLASVWLCCFAALCGAYLLLLGLYEGSWDRPGLMASLIGLNMALSPDNLVVFMMFLTDLPLVSHRRVISDGFLLACALRITTMLATARLLEAFAPLQMVLAVLVLTKGAQLLFEGWRKSQDTTAAEGTMTEEADSSLDNHWMVTTIRRCVDIKWTEETDGRCCVCEPSRQGLGTFGMAQRCALTRTAVLAMAIGVGDLTFSSDNIAAALALSTDGFTLTVSITLSILLLRPVFFLMAAFIRYLDALDTALGVILVLIGTKLCLGFAGIETPLWLFVGLLTTWRLLVLGYTIGRVYNNRT